MMSIDNLNIKLFLDLNKYLHYVWNLVVRIYCLELKEGIYFLLIYQHLSCQITLFIKMLLCKGKNWLLFNTLFQILTNFECFFRVSEDFKKNPGAVEAIAEQPGNPNHILIAYSRGLIVLWDKINSVAVKVRD